MQYIVSGMYCYLCIRSIFPNNVKSGIDETPDKQTLNRVECSLKWELNFLTLQHLRVTSIWFVLNISYVPNVKVLRIKEIVTTLVLIFLGKYASQYYKNYSETGKENM